MAPIIQKSHKSSDGGSKRPRPSAEAGPSKKIDAPAPRPTPAFVSSLKNEETDFPRGGGSSLTPLEIKQTYAEGRREAEEESKAEAESKGAKRARRPVSDREAKRIKKNEVKERKVDDKDQIRVEQLNYKRLTPGTKLLTRVHTVLPLHLILSLPNNLLAHVPITAISNTLTQLLSAEEEDDAMSEASSPSAPDLATLFSPGQYFPARVTTLYPTASQSFISQYPVTETTRLAARVEVSLVPDEVNAEVAKADLQKGYLIVGEVRSEEDKGWRVSLGLNKDQGLDNVEGWVSKDGPLHSLVPGQLVVATVSSSTAGGRVIQLSLDIDTVRKAQLSEVSNVGSILPGHQVSALVTAVVPNGLNVKVCGFFDGTIDHAHLGLGEADIDETYKIGKKIRARIIYDNLATTPRHFSLSVLPHILSFSSPLMSDSRSIEEAVPMGKLFNSVKVTRVIPEWGVVCRTDDGLEGFVHISHVSDERIPSLSGTTGQYRVGTLHRARVIGHSPLDGVVLLSFEQKVLDQVFMQVDELRVGQVLKGTIHRLTDKALFVNIKGSVDGVVWPLHYADIRLKHPEKRFKVGAVVRARIFALEPARSRVVLTLKKSLVDSEHDIRASFEDVQTGQVMPAVVSKILDKGCIVDLFSGLRAFIPQSEASQNFITNLSDIFYVGKPLNVRIISVDQTTEKIVASVRQALPTALAAEKLEVGQSVSGLVSQIHNEQVVIALVPSQLTALLSLSNLASQRHKSVDELRALLKIGERLDDLVIISKNATSGLLIVAHKRGGAGISRLSVSMSSIQPGQVLPGRVISHTPQGTMIQLAEGLRGRVHPMDASDDLSLVASGDGPLTIDEDVLCYVLKSNPSTRIIDLSTRKSRTEPEAATPIVDKEIGTIKELKEGEEVRGLVKNISGHGLFVSLGRTVTARVMIKELFDEFVKDWQSRFEVNQLVSGKILSVDEKLNLVEMTLRKNPSSRGSKKVASLGVSDFEKGQKVVATVKKVEAYGLFLQIEGSDVRGLCHKSEISDNKKQDVSQALKGFREGDQVKAVIVDIDREKGRVNFGIKASYFKDEFAKSVNEEEEGEEQQQESDGEDEEADGSEEDNGQEVDDDEDEDEDEDEEDEDDENEDDDEEDDDEIDEEEGGEEDEEVVIDLAKPSVIAKLETKSSSTATAPAGGLNVAGGFDWSGAAPGDAESSDESSDDDEPAPTTKPSKSKSKARAHDLTSTAPEGQPESATDFERALLASPNSSFLWIQYMSFQLQLHEVEKARRIGRQALEKIAYREEEEKLNVWMALVNLELGFGTPDSAEKVFREAAGHNDARTVYMRYAEALIAAGKEDMVEELYKRIVKKFSAYPESWTKFAEFYLKKGDVDQARALLPRATKSLDKSKHVETIEKMAILEFKHGEAERGKTLFEGLIDRYPKRLDLWSVYIDQLAKTQDVQGCRGLFERILAQKLTSKKAKFLFKKWFSVETRIGDEAGQDKAKERAREWVAANAASREEGEEGEDEE
ncbi:hypothetical protein BCR39DRAFT_515324 [Naematelia encephala]|uniref:S1 motif domain-containing protein n=1 Tax=Naematelia encephala TaxID=71784 RepID=A0A1Y2BJU2_9TREE|nr:hypothetical protein BCR39DRAFT_515324 [Naematelia encephala]